MIESANKKRSFVMASDPDLYSCATAAAPLSLYEQYVIVDSPAKPEPKLKQSSVLFSMKKKKNNLHASKPELIKNYESQSGSSAGGSEDQNSQHQQHLDKTLSQLFKFFIDNKHSFNMELFPERSGEQYSQLIHLDQEFIISENYNKYNCFNGPILLVFYGAMNQSHLKVIDNCHEELYKKYSLQVIGVSANVNSNHYNFPILSDDKATFAKFFQVLDPLGGAIYPLDKMFLIDAQGCTRAEFNMKSSFCQYNKNGMYKYLGNEEIIVNLVECLEYLKSEQL